MAVYIIAVILSFAFSRYKNLAWSGANDRFEGTYILICYIFMLFYTINTIDNKQILKIIFYSVIISQLLLQIIGIAQFTGHDPFQTVIGQKIIIPNYTINKSSGYTIWQRIDELAKETPPRSLIINSSEHIRQTVYSFNNLSFYLCVVIPIFVMLFILCSSIKQKIAMAVMFELLFINICAANASGGFLGLFCAFMAAVITFRKHIIKWRYQLLIIITLAGVSFVLTNRYMKHTDKSALSEQISRQIFESVSKDETKDKIDYFINNNDSIVVSVNNNELKIKINKDAGHVIDNISDSQGMQPDLQFNNKIISSGDNHYKALAISFMDKRFANLEIFIPAQTGDFEDKKMYMIKLKDEKKIWPFLVNQEGTYCLTEEGALVKLRKVPHIGFKNKQGFGTGRGYIWSRTFPLMPETFILGHGADTFAMSFPQNDFTGLYYYYGWDSEKKPIVDKPHNFILLNFVNTGGISAIALTAIIIIYIVQSFGLYSKNIQYDIFSKIGAGIYLGIIAFFVAGMFYDTSVNIMPLIYGLLGIGISCNYFVKANLNAAT
jgi:membrane protein implicated in regulation of membrane protease activity